MMSPLSPRSSSTAPRPTAAPPTESVERISVFDMLKVGIGPSSSHTLGPWRAIQRWIQELGERATSVASIEVHLYGSLALTGKGHATDSAICLALLGEEPETVCVDGIGDLLAGLRDACRITIGGRAVAFDPVRDVVFHDDEQLPLHPNGMRCVAHFDDDGATEHVYYSIGGGFVISDESELTATDRPAPPFACQTARDLEAHTSSAGLSIAQAVRRNEESWFGEAAVRDQLGSIWRVMLESAHRGCRTEGSLPGGLSVSRRAPGIARALLKGEVPADPDDWLACVRDRRCAFGDVIRWTSCFAIAVNEENAALGRVVTAPTNGAAGVIPGVLLHHICFGGRDVCEREIEDFLLIAGEIGSLFKKGATISAALGGCQAEIGVSSAMAAGALTEVRGGSVGQALMAAEMAMEHHLGMTCDPVGGLVQVPCIERNAMGAVKAINAAELALTGDPSSAKVSLDDIIDTMWETAQGMSERYKETSRGGLALQLTVGLSEC